ncbi:MAG: hypothetical protein ACXQS8_06105, partial [Candidatus Helarchaeales archaeon]
LNKILQILLIEFYHAFPKIDHPQIKSVTEKDEDFKKFMDRTIKWKVSDRSLWFFGPITGVVLAVLAVFLAYEFTVGVLGGMQRLATLSIPGFVIDLTDGISPEEFLNIQTLFAISMGAVMTILLGSFLFPGFIAGMIAGSRKKGIWSGILIVIAVFIITLLLETVKILPAYELNIFVIFVVMLPFIIIMNLLTGYFGGYLAERRRLWPLPHEELPEKIASQLNIFFEKISSIGDQSGKQHYEETYEED